MSLDKEVFSPIYVFSSERNENINKIAKEMWCAKKCVSYKTFTKSINFFLQIKQVLQYHAIAGPTVVFSTSLIAFIFTLITIFKYRILFTKFPHISTSIWQDVILFGQALVTLCFQLSLVAYYVMILISQSRGISALQAFALQYFNYVNDISSLCNPIALMVVCKFARIDFIRFLSGYKLKAITIGPWSTTVNHH